MKKKIVGILVCTLLIAATALPVAGMMNINETSDKIPADDNYSLQHTIGKGSIMSNWLQQAKLIASDGALNDRFGGANSIDGEYAILGAYNDDDNGADSGSAYIFKRSGTSWSQQAKLIASDGTDGDNFGGTVSIFGDRVIIGAYGDDDNGFYSGSAYVFKNSGTSWFQESKLLASDGAASDWFGGVVSISGEYAIIGASMDDDNGAESGSAYIFKRNGNTWTEQAKLTALDGAADDYFGFCVAIDGEYAIVGAYGDDDNGAESGSAYIFKRSGTTWSQEAKLTATDGATDDWFSFRVSISGDYAIIGSYKDDDSGSDSGSAYIFKRSGTTWSQEAKLTATDGAAGDWFGYTVAIDGNRAIIGAHQDDDLGQNSGSAYIFQRTGITWSQEAKLTASDGAAADAFGGGVSIDGIYALAGAPFDDDSGSESGSSYVFERSNQPPSAPTITGTTSGSAGTSYPYQFTSVDPDGDDIAEYLVNWSDGSDENITGPFASGSPATASHTWSAQGNYVIRAKAKDVNGLIGPEGTLSVTIPRSRIVTHSLSLRLIERFPNLFQILRTILRFQ